MKNKKIYKVMSYHFFRALILFLIFFVLLDWFTLGTFDFINNFFFALIISGGGGVLIFLPFAVIPPEINQETVEKRKEAFKKHLAAVKLTTVIAFSFMLFFMVFRSFLAVSLFGFSFLQAVAVSLGIGLTMGIFCSLIVWFIIQLEKPPFQNWND